MGMEMKYPAGMPDTYGLPQHRVTTIIKQRVGDEIHFLCGNESFGQTHYHFIMIMKATDVLREAQITQALVMETLTDKEISATVKRH